MPQVQETWSLHIWVSAMGQWEQEEEEEQGIWFWWQEEEEILKVFFEVFVKVFITQEELISKAHAFVGKEMDSEEESASEEVEVESEEESDSGVASLDLAWAYVAKSIFNTEDNGLVTNADAKDEDDSAPTYTASWHVVPR